MVLRRVFVDRVEGGEALSRGRSAHHLARVARLVPGEQVEISDQVTAYRATTVASSPHEVRFSVQEALPSPESLPRMDAALAIIKFQRFEWALEKLTELGVHSIVPVIAARSDTKLVAAAPKRLERWRRIAFEASQQSRRLSVPEVLPPAGFAKFLKACEEGARLLAHPGRPALAAVYAGGPATFLVGPEGGWTDEERRLARERGFATAGLGATVLRAETAAVAFAAVCAGGRETGGSG